MNWRDDCMTFMLEIMKRPCAISFLDPIYHDENNSENYINKVRHPMDLSTIKEKLQINEYKDIDEFKHDFQLIWTNAERTTGKSAPEIRLLAAEIKKIFLKKFHSEKPLNLKTWGEILRKPAEKLAYLIQNSPDSISQYNPFLLSLPALPKITDNNFDNFLQAHKLLPDKSDARHLMGIIRKFDPSYPIESQTPSIDLDKLEPRVFWSLDYYVRKRLEEQNIPYPTNSKH